MPSSSPMRRLLLAEDDRDFRELLTAVLEGDGATVVAVANGCDALEALRRAEEPFCAAVLDARMPSMSGLEVVRAARRTGIDVPILLLTSFGDADVHRHALRIGRTHVLEKPLDPEDLMSAVRALGAPERDG